MTRHPITLGGLLGGFIAVLSALHPAAAQEKYPSRPIEFIVPWGPGGGADQVARKASHLMEPLLGVSIPVLNVPGATGITGMTKMLTAPADGYTLQVMTGDTFALAAAPNPRFKLSDLIALAIMIQQPSGFLVKQDAPWKTWADLEKDARARTLKVAVTGFGSPDDLTVNFFRGKGLKLESIPYAKPGERYSSILGEHADILYEQAGDVRSFIDSKQMRPIIFFYPKRFEAFPDIVVSKELGYDITLPQFRVILMRAGTDAAKVKMISDALAKVAADADFKNYLKDQYADPNSYVPGDKSPAYMQSWLEDARKLLSQTAGK